MTIYLTNKRVKQQQIWNWASYITKWCQDYQVVYLNLFRSSHQRYSFYWVYLRKRKLKNVVLRNFSQNSQGKHLCVRVSFLKSIKKETFAQLFSCEFCKFFFTEQLLQSWLLLIATNGASFYCSFSPPSLAR